MKMNNSKRRSSVVKTRHFRMEREETAGNFDTPWEIRRKTVGGESLKKGSEKITNNMLLGTIEYSRPDKYGTTTLKLLLKTGLRHEELEEILNAMDSEITSTEYVNYISVKEPRNENLRVALKELSFVKDPAVAGNLVFEMPASNWLVTCALLGVAAGLLIGSMLYDPALGMLLGFSLGMLLGLYVRRKDTEKRKLFRECRMKGAELPPGTKRL